MAAVAVEGGELGPRWRRAVGGRAGGDRLPLGLNEIGPQHGEPTERPLLDRIGTPPPFRRGPLGERRRIAPVGGQSGAERAQIEG